MTSISRPIEEIDLLTMVLDPKIKRVWVNFNHKTGFSSLISLSYDERKGRFDLVMSKEDGPCVYFFNKAEAQEACTMFNEFIQMHSEE